MTAMAIRTKIVATVGPATADPQTLLALAQAGCDCFRVNFSHGTPEQHLQMLQWIRQVQEQQGAPLAVMADLCGPKIRVGPIRGGSMVLADGQEITVHRQLVEGDPTQISTTLKELVDEVKPGQTILLDDGRIRLEVARTHPPESFVCQVVQGGALSSGKGVNVPQTELSLSALTEKDRQDVQWLCDKGFDYVALSFVRRSADVDQLRKLLADCGCDAHVIAKIEKPQALEHLEEIVQSADAVMVARGDLGVEMDLPSVPVAQKRIAAVCQAYGKCCIIATQMLESMTQSPAPTRAEVSDVANAVLDQADAVMLSGETAVGKYPVAAVAMMKQIVRKIQDVVPPSQAQPRVFTPPARTAAAIAAAVRQIIAIEQVALAGVFTITGSTALMLAKNRLSCPVLALSPDPRTVQRMNLYYGVIPVRVGAVEHTRQVLAVASQAALQKGLAKAGDKMIVISGRPLGRPGNTNTLVVHTVGT